MAVWSKSFADLESSLWHETLRTVSAHWFSAVHAARLMRKHGRGLIALVTDNTPGSPGAHRGQILHDLGHECLNNPDRRIRPRAGIQQRRVALPQRHWPHARHKGQQFAVSPHSALIDGGVARPALPPSMNDTRV